MFLKKIEIDTPSLGFGLQVSTRLIYCEAFANDESYFILFNSIRVAEIKLGDDCYWFLWSGKPTSQSLIDEIGQRIENHFM